MTASLFLDNLFAWSAQVALLVSVGALASMTLASPRARLIFWQGILAIALLLPAVEPWQQPIAENTGSVAIATSAAPVILVHQPSSRFVWRREYLLLLIAAGAALRFLWIGVGLLRLRRHRLDARMLTIPPVRFSNPRVRWFVSSTVGGPVTFGFLNPSILLPVRVAELPDDLREAIAHHELAHVRRRDWLFVLAEEAIRSLLWFHPAIWFVLSRIQLAREQVVDAEVVGLTHDRERYLDALVAVAAQRLLPDVAPAPLFLKKRQLAVRVAAVLKETRMSKPRTFLSFTTVCSAALLAARLAVWMFPLQAPAQSPQGSPNYRFVTIDGPGVVVEPGAKILHRSSIFFPPGSPSGSVVVESTVNAKGEVTDARVISGPDELRHAALSSVLTWHFSPEGGLPPTVQTTIRFAATSQPAKVPATPAIRASVLASPTHAPNWILKSIDTQGLSDELAEQVRASLPVHVGDPLGGDDFERVSAALGKVDEHLTVQMNGTPPDATLTISLWANTRETVVSSRVTREPAGVPGVLIDNGPSVSAAAATAPTAPQRVRVGGQVQAANLIKKVTPLYPPEAKQARISGTVRFTVIIGKDGTILSLQLVSGHPLLVDSARDAVQQWLYRPTLLNGSPVEVITLIDVNYTLTE